MIRLGLGLGFGLGDADALLDDPGDALGEAEADFLGRGLTDALGFALGEAEADFLGLGLADALGFALGDAEALDFGVVLPVAPAGFIEVTGISKPRARHAPVSLRFMIGYFQLGEGKSQ